MIKAKTKKILSVILSTILVGSVFTGCGAKTATNEVKSLKVGVTAGPHEQVVEKVKEVAEKQGLNIEIITFNDYVQPNIQLNDKQIDVNIFQHQPYLDKFNGDHNMNIISVGNAVNFPMGVYSIKIKSLDELKSGDKVSLPNDPTNGARALMLLEAANVIKLKEGIGAKATVRDIIENQKNIEFVELEAPMVARSLPDVTAAVINTNFAVEAKLNPVKDSIFIEPKESPWINVIAVRPENKDDDIVKELIKVYQTEEIRKFIDETFGGAVVAGF
jgi:D-methionine transport system substrate-binding protein